VWHSVIKNIISPSFFEELIVTGEKFLPMMEKTAWCHIPAGTVFQLDGASTNFSYYVHAFPNREFPESCIGRAGPVPLALVLQILVPYIFFLVSL
jgi:hypothetical protein